MVAPGRLTRRFEADEGPEREPQQDESAGVFGFHAAVDEEPRREAEGDAEPAYCSRSDLGENGQRHRSDAEQRRDAEGDGAERMEEDVRVAFGTGSKQQGYGEQGRQHAQMEGELKGKRVEHHALAHHEHPGLREAEAQEQRIAFRSVDARQLVDHRYPLLLEGAPRASRFSPAPRPRFELIR